jgi:dienelactone hydrolase
MRLTSLVTILVLGAAAYSDDDPTRLFPDKSELKDVRLGPPKDLNGYFPFDPPATKEGWNDRSAKVRTQLLVSTGLWPMPEKTPLNAVIYGKIERDGYTVEKVYFASMPSHYVSGNLYRPTGKADGKRPAILNPHGHWPNGRFMEASNAEVKNQMATKDKQTGQPAEGTEESARYPLQAKCVGLARMGFVVFHYDMVGYADSTAIPHRAGFTDAEAELRLQSFMGLQTWNSVRALDFLLSLPDVDPKKIGVTGASGGGTQSFMICAVDDRPAVAFPAVMVSTAMQGGCICENCSYLRVGTGNVEIAGLFAPKPLAMSAANDWTLEIEKKGLPELKKLYRMVGNEENVTARCWPEFGHNYNQVSREMMYTWFNKHLLGKSEEVKEQPFKPIPPKDLSVYDAEHPRPKDELDAKGLRAKMTEAADKQLKALEPTDEKSLAEFRRVVGSALRVMIGEELPKPGALTVRKAPKEVKLTDGVTMHLAALGREGEGDMVPHAGVFKGNPTAGFVVWVHPQGKASLFEKGELNPAVKALVDKGYAVVAPDVFQTGELTGQWPLTGAEKKGKSFREPPQYPVDTQFAGFTFGYNRPVFSQRVHDILTAVAFARDIGKAKTIHLVGWEGAGPWVAAARALCGDAVSRTAIDLNQFRFDKITHVTDENLLPGALKYGGLPAFLALCAPGELFVHNHAGTSSGQLSKAAYDAAKASDHLKRQPEKAKPEDVIAWLIR